MSRSDSEQRSKILEAAIREFAVRGLKGASTRIVGQSAGVNSALIYYYFENKDTLFSEAIRFVMNKLVEHLSQRRRDFTDARDRLGFLVNGLFDYYSDHPDRMRLMSVAVIMHAALFGKVIDSIVKDQVLLPLEIMQDGMNKGELKPQSPRQAWWNILGMCIFTLHMRTVMAHGEFGVAPFPAPDPDNSRETIIDLLVEGLAMKPAGNQVRTAQD